MQVAYTMSRLGRRARSWAYNQRTKNSPCFPTWENLKVGLTSAFKPPKSEFRTRARFLHLKQGKKSVYEYAQETQAIIASVSKYPIDPFTQVSVFLNGLREGPIRKQLFREFPDTLERAITIALQEEFVGMDSIIVV